VRGLCHPNNAEIAKNHLRVADGDLHMRSVAKSCTGINQVAFFKHSIDGVVSLHPFAFTDLVHHLNHGTVQLTLYENAVLPNRVHRKWGSCCCGNPKGRLVGKGQFIHHPVVGQVIDTVLAPMRRPRSRKRPSFSSASEFTAIGWGQRRGGSGWRSSRRQQPLGRFMGLACLFSDQQHQLLQPIEALRQGLELRGTSLAAYLPRGLPS